MDESKTVKSRIEAPTAIPPTLSSTTAIGPVQTHRRKTKRQNGQSNEEERRQQASLEDKTEKRQSKKASTRPQQAKEPNKANRNLTWTPAAKRKSSMRSKYGCGGDSWGSYSK